ncbi:MAG: Ig-like domain-containing protein [Planctomycetes bacterium]|nr:Ig-like domain-containing protein [Planctomycetota bacterium]
MRSNAKSIWSFLAPVVACTMLFLAFGCDGSGTSPFNVPATGTNTNGGGGNVQINQASNLDLTTMTPGSGSAVPANTVIELRFNQPVNVSSVTASSIYFRANGNLVAVNHQFSEANQVVRITPVSPLVSGASYEVVISPSVTSVDGESYTGPTNHTFTTTSSAGAGNAPDTAGPIVLSTNPGNNTVGVLLDVTISAVFNESVNPSTVTSNSMQLLQGGSSIPGTFNFSARNTIVTFKSNAQLLPSTSYTLNVGTGIKDLVGNSVQQSVSSSFTTATAQQLDQTPPTVLSVTPANGATNVPTNTTVLVSFSEPMNTTTVSATSFMVLDPSNMPVVGTFTWSNQNKDCTFTPAAGLSPSTTYSINMNSTIADLAGNGLAQTPYISSFTTAATATGGGGGTTGGPFQVATVVPANGATNIPVTSTVQVTFSSAAKPSTVTTNTIQVTDASGATVPGTVALDPTNTIATFTPNANFTNNANYNVTVTGVTDPSGGPLATDPYVSTFTTGSAGCSGFCITSVWPQNGATGILPLDPIILQFSQPVDISRTPTGNPPGSRAFNNAFDTTYVTVDAGQGAVSGTVVFSNGNQTAMWWPENPSQTAQQNRPPGRIYMQQGLTYTVTINGATKSASTGVDLNTSMGGPFVFTFQTVPSGLMPIRTYPYPGKTNVGLQQAVEVEFSGPVDLTLSNGGWPIEWMPAAGGSFVGASNPTGAIRYLSPAGATASPNNAYLIQLVPPSPLTPNTVYQVTVRNAVASGASTPTQVQPYTFTFTTGQGAAADTTSPFLQDPVLMSPFGTYDTTACVPSAKPFNFGGVISLIATQAEPITGALTNWSEKIDPDSLSLTNLRYSPFDTNISQNTGGILCQGGNLLFGGNQQCQGFTLAAPIPGIYSVDNTTSNGSGQTIGLVYYIPDVDLKTSLGSSYGVNANAFHIDVASRATGAAGPAITDFNGNPTTQNADHAGGGVVFSVQ